MKNKHPSLIFGATLTIGEYVMPQFLIEHQTHHPDTALTMITANTHELLERISDGEIDFAIVEGYFDKTQYDYLTFSTEPYIAVAGKPPQSGIRPAQLTDLLGENASNPGNRIRDEGDSGEMSDFPQSFDPRFCRDLRDRKYPCLKAMAAAGIGITFLYRSAVEEELKSHTLYDITPEDFSVTHDFTLIWQKGSIFASRYRTLFKEWRH